MLLLSISRVFRAAQWAARVALLVLTALTVVACFGSPKIMGRVRLAGERTVPFPGVTVRLYDALLDPQDPRAVVDEVITDHRGKYTFVDVKPGTYFLSMSAPGSPLPAGISRCTFASFTMEGEWLFMSGGTKDGGGVALALLQEKFTISSAGATRYNVTYKCY